MISYIRTLKFSHLELHRSHTMYALSDGRPLWNKLSVTAPVGIRVVSDRFYPSKFCHNLFWRKNTSRTLFISMFITYDPPRRDCRCVISCFCIVGEIWIFYTMILTCSIVLWHLPKATHRIRNYDMRNKRNDSLICLKILKLWIWKHTTSTVKME